MLRAPSFANRLLRWVSTVFSEMNSREAISFDVNPPAKRFEDFDFTL